MRIAINGFGRIGRLVFRSAMKQSDVSILAINDLLDVNHLAYLLKYDSVHGICEAEIKVSNGNLVVNNNEISISAERDPSLINWENRGVEIALECTGIFTSLDLSLIHI